MSIQVGDVLKVVAILSWLDGDIAQNVFNAVITGTGGPYDDGDIVADALTWVGTMYANLTSNMSDEIGSSAWTFNPSEATDQLPRGVAGLINARTTDPDVNGKKYLPGICEGGCTDGQFGAGQLSAHANFADDWMSSFTGGTSGASWVPGIWSPTRTNFYACSGTAIIPSIPAYQRRRKRGVGI